MCIFYVSAITCIQSYLLKHPNEFGESPIQLYEDGVDELGRHFLVLCEELTNLLLEQERRARICAKRTD